MLEIIKRYRSSVGVTRLSMGKIVGDNLQLHVTMNAIDGGPWAELAGKN